ncbi:MAG: DUF362 domain-containing protein [Clostridia bacterium]|nr:DUF362 domain-containing protein [Clostridia bacterium]
MNEHAVSAVRCDGYDPDLIKAAMDRLFEPIDALDFVKPGATVAIKVNLVAAMKPEKAATTHPALVTELCRRIVERGATPVVGDSPGGPFTGLYLKGIYSSTGMTAIEKVGGRLNSDFDTVRCESFPEAEVLKNFTYSSWLANADAVINFAKLKTHGMMGMSAAVKNLFGAIPGTIKPEYHYRFPNAKDFANMLIDIDEYVKPSLSIVDGIVGMEGNGPTVGDPRHIGVLAASRSPYDLDTFCASVIGLSADKVPTLQLAIERGLGRTIDKIEVVGDGADVGIPDFKNIERANDIEFFTGLLGLKGKFLNRIAKWALSTRPKLKRSECVGCKRCDGICPAGAITMKGGKPRIDRGVCIRCFCCQEFCPKGALKVHRPLVARILTKSDSSVKKKKRSA